MSTENKSNFTFRLKSQAEDVDGDHPKPVNSTHNHTVRALAWLQGRASFYFCCTNQNGLIQPKEICTANGQTYELWI